MPTCYLNIFLFDVFISVDLKQCSVYMCLESFMLLLIVIIQQRQTKNQLKLRHIDS